MHLEDAQVQLLAAKLPLPGASTAAPAQQHASAHLALRVPVPFAMLLASQLWTSMLLPVVETSHCSALSCDLKMFKQWQAAGVAQAPRPTLQPKQLVVDGTFLQSAADLIRELTLQLEVRGGMTGQEQQQRLQDSHDTWHRSPFCRAGASNALLSGSCGETPAAVPVLQRDRERQREREREHPSTLHPRGGPSLPNKSPPHIAHNGCTGSLSKSPVGHSPAGSLLKATYPGKQSTCTRTSSLKDWSQAALGDPSRLQPVLVWRRQDVLFTLQNHVDSQHPLAARWTQALSSVHRAARLLRLLTFADLLGNDVALRDALLSALRLLVPANFMPPFVERLQAPRQGFSSTVVRRGRFILDAAFMLYSAACQEPLVRYLLVDSSPQGLDFELLRETTVPVRALVHCYLTSRRMAEVWRSISKRPAQ